jgi:predicted dehydrogenase
MKNEKSKDKSGFNRRDLLKGSLAVGASTFAIPAIVPSWSIGAPAPSNRITIGVIGTGGKGMGNLKAFMNYSDVKIVAVCDVDAAHLQKAREQAELTAGSCYNDFRELLARDDIDAVAVNTPDHWHVPISIAAIKAGKDVFCEKPLTLTIGGGRMLADASKRYGAVFQTGSQQRSDVEFRFGCELVRNGRIGKLQTIEVGIPGNNRDNPLDWQAQPVPDGFDYDMWLGPAQDAPYTPERCHYTFRFMLDYSGGQVTNWGAHYLDIAQWGIGADDSGPVEILGKGEFPTSGLFTTATHVDVTYTYANGVKLFLRTDKGYVRFNGTKGSVFIQRGFIETTPKSLVTTVIGPDEIHLYRSADHKRNFLDCIKSRSETVVPAEIGHRSSSLCHLANIAMLTGRPLNWDPQKERFTNDDAANRMLTRSMRPPWRL